MRGAAMGHVEVQGFNIKKESIKVINKIKIKRYWHKDHSSVK